MSKKADEKHTLGSSSLPYTTWDCQAIRLVLLSHTVCFRCNLGVLSDLSFTIGQAEIALTITKSQINVT